jgi:3-hydroxyacyl-CoA dehydrogenase
MDEAFEELRRKEPELAERLHFFPHRRSSIQEIAGHQGSSEKTVDRTLKRARSILKRRREKGREEW